MITKIVTKIENGVINKYGFENWRTILVFRLTSALH